MIKIIQKGTRRIETCENCGCIFSFEDEDVHKTTSDTDDKYNDICVVCPQCGLVIDLCRNAGGDVYKGSDICESE